MTRKLSTTSFFYKHWKWIMLSVLFCMLFAGALIFPSFASTTASASGLPASASSHSCKASYTVAAQDAFFTDDFTITNTSSKALHRWKVQILFASKQIIIQSWNGIFTQKGNKVIIKNTSSNVVVKPGSSIKPGFNASWNNNTPTPSSIKLNGVTCSLSLG